MLEDLKRAEFTTSISRYLFKIVLCGPGGVGKTSLFNRFISNVFQQYQFMTIGINYAAHYLNLPQGRVDLQIWDYGGQLNYRPFIVQFLDGTSGALLMFDLTSYSSFLQIEDWWMTLEEGLKKKVPILLVGCKDDLCEQNPADQALSNENIQRYVEKHKFIGYIRTSAKSGKNVVACFQRLTEALFF